MKGFGGAPIAEVDAELAPFWVYDLRRYEFSVANYGQGVSIEVSGDYDRIREVNPTALWSVTKRRNGARLEPG